MSKFTKALEKIQEEKEAKFPPLEKTPGLKLPPAGDRPDSVSYWERGIATLKNSAPDNRVVTMRFPDSIVSEQYRMLRTALQAQLAKEGAKVILISSSIHSEGKTLTAANLAVSLAENADCQVALVDADLRRGKVADYLGLGKRPGLSNFLSDGLTPKQVMVRNSLKNLLIIPRGEIAKKPSELVSSQKFHLLLTELRTRFDYILIDAPPIMSVADAGILAREADGILFIVQVGRTPKSVIAHAHQLFKQAGGRILGYVLTNVEYQSPEYRYYKYYYSKEEDPTSFKNKTQYRLKNAGWSFKNLEEKFNRWWEKRVLQKRRERYHRHRKFKS